MTKLIYGGWFVRDWGLDGDDPLEGGALCEEAGRIVSVGRYLDLRKRYPDAPTIGDTSYIVAPGFVNAHSHGRGLTTYQMGQPDEPLETRIVEILGRPEWVGTAIDSGGTNRAGPALYYDTLYSSAKQIASGITTTLHIDQYMFGSAEAYEKHARTVCQAYRDSGIRCALALGIRDRSSFPFADDHAFLATLSQEERQSPDLLTSRYMPFPEFLDLLQRLSAEFRDLAFQMGPWNPVFSTEDGRAQRTSMGA